MKNLLTTALLMLTFALSAQEKQPYMTIDTEEVIAYDRFEERVVYNGPFGVYVEFYESEIRMKLDGELTMLKYAEIYENNGFLVIRAFAESTKEYLFLLDENDVYIETYNIILKLCRRI